MEKASLTFEQQWNQQFADAEMAPPPGVWQALDGQLANQELASYKKQADTYRWIAAACLLLLFGAGFLYFGYGDLQTRSVADTQNIPSNETSTNSPNSSYTPTERNASVQNEKVQALKDTEIRKPQNSISSNVLMADNDDGEKSGVPLVIVDEENDNNYLVLIISNNENDIQSYAQDLSRLENRQMDNSTQLEAWKAEQLYGVADLSAVVEEDIYGLWAGVSMSGGSFDPQFGTSPNTADFASADPTTFAANSLSKNRQNSYEPSYEAGSSISGGVNVGGRVSKHVVLSSGVHYSAFSTGSAENFIATNVDTSEKLALTGEQGDVSFADVNNSSYELNGDVAVLNNEFRYLTIPIKAGYVLLDKKINVTLNTGLSSNILLDATLNQKNRTASLSNNLETSNNYKNVYFNFVSSVEFGYLIQQRYMVSVEPNYNQALTNFTDSDNSHQGKPKNFGLSLGLKYNF